MDSDLVDQLSNSDNDSLSIHDRHAQDTSDRLLSALHYTLLQPRGDVADVENLTSRGDVPRDLPQGTR